MTTYVFIESPYMGRNPEETLRNIRYARACKRDCLLRGEVPFASHTSYTQPGVLDDNDPEERLMGMRAGWEMLELFALVNSLSHSEMPCVDRQYIDLGLSNGMRQGGERAKELGLPVEQKSLGENWEEDFLVHEQNHSQNRIWGGG